MRSVPRFAAAASVVVIAALNVVACGAATQRTPQTTSSAATAQLRATAAVTPGPLPTQLPDALVHEAAHPDPNFDFGVVIQITLDGFHPAEMVAPCCQPLVWQNLTNVSQSIEMDAFTVHSGPIAPGGAYVYKPQTAVSLAYHSVNDPKRTGVVDLTPTQEP